MYVVQLALGIILSARFINGINIYNYGNKFDYLAQELNASAAALDTSSVETSWIEQPLDHFDTKESRTWKMRYFERHDLWKPGKPIYMFLGGEGEALPEFLSTGTMYELAEETDGAMYMAEHRYYGESKPFEKLTSENLAYLSSRQALADFAKLLESIKSSPKFKSSKVVVVGGSYSGNLAAWIKLIYPNLVDAAIASSAPVLAKKDFYESFETVSDDFEQYGSAGCWKKIEDMFVRYENLLKTNEGIEILKKEENICDYCDMTVSINQQNFFAGKVTRFMIKTQYGSPSDINFFCDSNFKSNFRHLEAPSLFWSEKNDCVSYDVDENIEHIKHTDYYTMLIPWTYQTCTEFGYFQTGTSDKQPFTKNILLELYIKMCSGLFGPDFDEGRVDLGVEEINKLYGGLKPNVTKVVFVNGDMDPWSKLGVLEDLSYEAPAKVISRSSHCRDLFSNKDGDAKELKEARKYIKELIKSWIGEGDY